MTCKHHNYRYTTEDTRRLQVISDVSVAPPLPNTAKLKISNKAQSKQTANSLILFYLLVVVINLNTKCYVKETSRRPNIISKLSKLIYFFMNKANTIVTSNCIHAKTATNQKKNFSNYLRVL